MFLPEVWKKTVHILALDFFDTPTELSFPGHFFRHLKHLPKKIRNAHTHT
jgi:hypothetical protein